jgi:putative membrane protein
MMWGSETNAAWLWLYAILSLVTVVALVVIAVRYFRGDSEDQVGPRRSAARRLLDERYRRGELTAEQYQQQRAELDDQS